ncbi:MAG: class I SAM-dependent methyltransferase [Oscillospiraceae bacterium]|jgi:ubiquinone/menaquinone biosynthesis C-methylase UbiE|nr:class I SAM-dependent methyltransferase [Oscillospiraceae bacterium]
MPNEKDNKRFWNRSAAFYDASRRPDSPAYDAVISRIRARLTPEMNVLELATGTGIIALRTADCCRTIEATDFSEEMIRVAKSKAAPENVTFAVADATALPYADGRFDAVIISNALHIMPNPQKALENIRRVLRDGGILFAPTYLRTRSFGEKIKVLIGAVIGFKTYSKWTKAEYLAFLAQNGWEVLTCEVFSATFPLAYVTAVKKEAE